MLTAYLHSFRPLDDGFGQEAIRCRRTAARHDFLGLQPRCDSRGAYRAMGSAEMGSAMEHLYRLSVPVLRRYPAVFLSQFRHVHRCADDPGFRHRVLHRVGLGHAGRAGVSKGTAHYDVHVQCVLVRGLAGCVGHCGRDGEDEGGLGVEVTFDTAVLPITGPDGFDIVGNFISPPRKRGTKSNY